MKHTIQFLVLAGALSACGDQYDNTLAAAKQSEDRNLPSIDELKQEAKATESTTPSRVAVDPTEIDTRDTSPQTTDATFERSAEQSTNPNKDEGSAAMSDALTPPGQLNQPGQVPTPTPAPKAPVTNPESGTDPMATPDAQKKPNGTPPSDAQPKDELAKLDSIDVEFLKKAAVAGLFEVESSELAVLQATTPEIRDFAQLMVTDHGAANQDVGDLAKQKGATVPKELDSEHSARLSTLRDLRGIEFDRQYRDIQITAHKDAIALFERAASESKDADVKALAERLLPTLRMHEEKLNAIPPTQQGS